MTWTRPARTPREDRPPVALSRPANWREPQKVVSGASSGAFPKRQYIRSKALLEACRQIPCQHSGIQDGTVVAAHSNWAVHGKGKSIKADDNRVAALCHAVHMELDQGSKLTDAERWAIWWPAHQKTVRELHRLGLWPQDVPLPDIRDMQ